MSDYIHQIKNRRVSISEVQPDYTKVAPKTIGKTMRHDEVLYVAGIGPKDSGVMFVAQSLEDDEAREVQGMNFGFTVRQPATYLKGDIGAVLKDCAMGVNLDLEAHYYTAFIKWLLPRTERNKPTKEMVEWAATAFDAEIKECKPKIIVCLGKVPFDYLVDMRINATDALGGWFWSEKYQAKVFLMEKPAVLLFKPERLEQFRLLFREVQKMITHGDAQLSVKEYQVIYNSAQLRELVDKFRAENRTLFAVDCEWGGTTFIDGRLRTLQMCWEPGKAAAIRFRDDKDNYSFDVSYEEAGEILGEWFNQPQVKYIGHYVSVDLPWMHRWLRLDWYQKCIMDTAFATQVVDESAPMGLEWLAMYATDLGRYDLPLLLWKKANPQKEEDGYAFIPDDILLPYSMMDVDVTFQGYLWLKHRLRLSGVTDYYNNIFHPFVTDVFTSFVINGLPIDRSKMENLRKIYNYSYGILRDDFRIAITAEAKFLLIKRCSELTGNVKSVVIATKLIGAVASGNWQEQLENCEELNAEQKKTLLPYLEHLESAPNFNIRSKPQMMRWLFDVKRHTPLKSTDNKPKGLRSMPWEKVMALPPDKRADYKPASDKQTLQILSEKDPMVNRLFDLNVVGNVCQSFLKEADIDDDTGEVLSENGLFSHLCSDERIHNFYATTETGRPRTWKPNVLNWPSYVTERIAKTIGRLMMKLEAAGNLPDEYKMYLPKPDSEKAKVPSIRSCVVAPPGWCIVESDYQTAEVRGLAWLSGDKTLMRLMSNTDETFVLVKDGDDIYRVRTSFRSEAESGIPAENQDQQVLNSIWKDGIKLRDVSESEFIRTSSGELRHPKHDLHWSLAEMVYKRPREKMIDKVHRQVGKTGNFSCLSRVNNVLTNLGTVNILSTDPAIHKLWDGVEWVDFDGIIEKPPQHTITYHGITATVDHGIWTDDGREIFFGEAALLGLSLAQTQESSGEPRKAEFCSLSPGSVDTDSGRDKHTLLKLLQEAGFEMTVEPVYDLVNAGPRHRFTAGGVLVSNTAYGASENSLERKIEADTGVKPDPGTGKKLLDALESRQPRAVEFLKELENIPVSPGVYVAASGRKRRFTKHSKNMRQENWKAVQSLLSSLGREARNYPMQESVAATAARAGTWLLSTKYANNLQGFQLAILYDSVVTLCPVNERWIWMAAHELFMHLKNAWNYDGRILRYPIDTDLNTAWSEKASGDAKINLNNPEFEKTPVRLLPVLAWFRTQIKQAQ